MLTFSERCILETYLYTQNTMNSYPQCYTPLLYPLLPVRQRMVSLQPASTLEASLCWLSATAVTMYQLLPLCCLRPGDSFPGQDQAWPLQSRHSSCHQASSCSPDLIPHSPPLSVPACSQQPPYWLQAFSEGSHKNPWTCHCLDHE